MLWPAGFSDNIKQKSGTAVINSAIEPVWLETSDAKTNALYLLGLYLPEGWEIIQALVLEMHFGDLGEQ